VCLDWIYRPDYTLNTPSKRQTMKNKIDVGLIFAACGLVLVITVGSFAAGYLSNNGYTQFRYPLFSEAFSILDKNGIAAMPDSKIVEYELIRGLVTAYDDPYTVFVEPVQHEIESDQLEGKFGGIGAEIQRDTDGVIRVFPYPDSPAMNAGVPSGCVLLSVDSLKISIETPVEEIISTLRGEVGTSVALTYISPENGAAVTAEIERKEFAIPSVSWRKVPEREGLGLVKINGISATTAAEIKSGIEELFSNGVGTIILDLRGNGGGLVDAGIEIVEMFTSKDTPIITLHYPDKPDTQKLTRADGDYASLPIYILADQNTASSAEIVVGALQLANRALVIGRQTYGKNSIQLVYDLQDGSSIHVSAATWALPGNSDFGPESGIRPDIELPSETPSDSEYIQAVLDLLKD